MAANTYETLDEQAIIETVARLRARVSERFPERGLTSIATYLEGLAAESARQARALRRPNWVARALVVWVLLAGGYTFYLFRDVLPDLKTGAMTVAELTQGLDASFNIIVLVGLAVLFLVGLEARFKRRSALAGLHKLRAISHVIDMHQLTKDPASILGAMRTGSSPARDLTHDQLLRYLDYCAEMLAMIGKLAALYAQYFPDGDVMLSVNEIEVLTTNLSRTIWQKIVIVQGEPQETKSIPPAPPALAPPPSPNAATIGQN